MILILRRLLTLSVALGLVFALQQTVLAAQLLHYPAQPGATDVSQLDISGALDTPLIAPVLEDFHRRNPDIALTYRNLTTLEVYRTFIAGNENPQADVVMSSAMPWQYQLANNGYARSLDLANAERWPAWARWRQELFGITFEPVVIVYRKALAERYGDIGSHAELLSLLEREREALRGRVVTYDPARSGAGYT
ncbi:extracellular solute-binding protein, partial [Halomonas sp. BBD48]|nr:extracellular solute-binding protein [Halomonas sp. BBD48]